MNACTYNCILVCIRVDKMSKKEFLGVKLTKMVSQKQLQLVGKHTIVVKLHCTLSKHVD
jgi:hypothetical protein